MCGANAAGTALAQTKLQSLEASVLDLSQVRMVGGIEFSRYRAWRHDREELPVLEPALERL